MVEEIPSQIQYSLKFDDPEYPWDQPSWWVFKNRKECFQKKLMEEHRNLAQALGGS